MFDFSITQFDGFDLIINQGCDWYINLTLKDNTGNPINLNGFGGFTFVGEAKLKYSQATPDFSFTFDIADQELYPGQVWMILNADDTESLPLTEFTQYLYEVDMTDPTGKILRILHGHADVTAGVIK